jgi:DNA helicase-2/ATP-dependent DNA helicase PcrA
LPNPIVAEELDLLDQVTRRIAEMAPPVTADEAPIVEELKRIREQLLDGTEAKDTGALTQQWHRQNALLSQLRSSRGGPQVDPTSPYFAHLRLREGDRERDLCVGRATCIDGGVRVVDWRNSPISRIFYRYQQGEDFEETLADRVRTGVVVARRTVTIQDARLVRVEAPEGIFTRSAGETDGWQRIERDRPSLAGGESMAIRAREPDDDDAGQLGIERGGGARVDKRLPEITGLIDPEQFGLITRPSSGFLAIRGTAGSGKTTVALHRIAYLAYDEPRVDSDQTLVVVFSPALRNYVSHVLPSLGLSHVRITTFSDWASEQRRRHFPQLPRASRDDAPAIVQRIKLHPMIDTALQLQCERSAGPRTAVQALDDWTSALTNTDQLAEACKAENGDFRPEDLTRFSDWNRRRNEELFARIEGDADSQAEIDPEDEALLLRAWQLRVGPLRWRGKRPLRYRHVAVDEVQDFSPVEVRVLLDCLDRNRSITLAGDTQQHVIENSGFTSWSGFLARLGVPGTAIDTLRISYRSTRQILEFALSLLGDLREDEEPPVATRSGPNVELFRFTDRGACVGFLADALRELGRREPNASVAILTPSKESSGLYYQGLANSDLPSVRQVANQDFTFAPGIEVTEIEQVKGLEFDYVVLVDVSDENFPDTPGARRVLHVGATRAIHQLWLTSVGTPSSLVSGVAAG